ncbi:MAG TPA: polysaccharide deacetylase family protein [Allosphingosinicella sp.]|jgi:peptidoglycan/xylan/chitin deacetylase (PgdA/CDA1 family)|nr:polysaccharide deacetylase family protein [Allosphingosinicella sp.]
MIRLFLALLLLSFATSAFAAPRPEPKRIALSFDDVPRGPGGFLAPEQRTRRLISGLGAARVRQAVFFVTTGNLDKPDGQGGEARIGRYSAAGHVVANHSHAHRRLSQVSAEDYLRDVDRAARWLKDRPNSRPWFRFPFLDEGRADKAKRDAVRAGLAERKLLNGYVTVDGADWNMEALTIAARKAGKPMDMKALRHLYVETMVGAANFYDGLARRTLGRSPAHMLLLHETDLAALFLPALVKALRKDGWEIVTADEAYSDPIALALPDTPSAQGTRTEALAWQKGLPAPRWYERENVKVANALFAERVLKENPAP